MNDKKTVTVESEFGNLVIDLCDFNDITGEYASGGIVYDGLFADVEMDDAEERDELSAALDGVTSLVLAHACAGVDVTDARYVKGLRVSVENIANILG